MRKKVLTMFLVATLVLSNFTVLNVFADEITYTEDLCIDQSKISASSTGAGRAASRAIDNDITRNYSSTAWQPDIEVGTEPHWIKYDFGEGNKKRIKKYTIVAGYIPAYGPRDFILQGSNDDVNWTDVDTRVNATYVDVQTPTVFTTDNENDYRYYRLYITKTEANIVVIIKELEMMEDINDPAGSSSDIELDVASTTYDLVRGNEFTVDVDMRNATNIYAEEFNVNYDPSLFEFVSIDSVNQDKLKLYHEDHSVSGKINLILASLGADYAISEDSNIVKLKFRAIGTGTGTIGVESGDVANGEGTIFHAVCFDKSYNVTGSIDVNNDGTLDLGDLAIASRLLASGSEVWGTYTPDVDYNGSVNDLDLTTIVSVLINN